MNIYCNTTAGEFPIFRDLITVGHDCGGFFPPVQGTGEIICACHWRVSRAELTARAESARTDLAPAPRAA